MDIMIRYSLINSFNKNLNIARNVKSSSEFLQ